MARLSNAFLQYSDDAGKPIPEGKLYFYDSGTTNLRNTYVDSGLSIPNANPLLLDGAGRVNSPFLDGNYRVILTDKDDNQIREIDPVQGSLSDSQWSDWSITTTYGITDIVRASNGKYYISLTGSNLGNDPVSSPINWSQISFVTAWNVNETYSMDDNVFESGVQYKSLVDGNIGNLPSTSPAEWGVPTGGVVAGNPVSVLTNDVPYLEAGNDLSDVADAPTARTNLGLGNVNNTSDLDKPVSTATQTALDLKANSTDVYDKTASDARYLLESNNLSDLVDAATSRANLEVDAVARAPSLTGSKVEIVAGTIRQNSVDPTKWDYIIDSEHAPVGISGSFANVVNGFIEIVYDKTYSKVISFIAGPDDNLQKYLFTVGGSVGLSGTTLATGLYKENGGDIYYTGSSWSWDESLVGFIDSATWNAAEQRLDIVHKSTTNDIISASALSRGGSTVYLPAIETNSATSIALSWYDSNLSRVPAEATRMRCRLSRPLSGNVAADITFPDISDGNIWFYGIFEV